MPPTEQAVTELKDQLGTVHEEFKSWAEKEEQERTTLGEATSETKARVEKLDEQLTGISEKIDDFEKKMAALEAANIGVMKRPMEVIQLLKGRL